MSVCAFCEIVKGETSASVIAESTDSVAFCDVRQPHASGTGGHVLVVPRRHTETLDALDPQSAADLIQLAMRVAGALRSEFGDAGYSLWQSNGEAAFQEVPHVHLHLLTRKSSDGLLRVYPETTGIPADADRGQLDALAQRLRRRLAG